MTKILLFDIETAPSLGYVWGKYEQDVLEFQRDWYVLCWAAKWLGKRKMYMAALPDFKLYKKDPENDREVMAALWDLLDEADVVMAHNGDQFDVKKVNARFVQHGFEPPSPYQTIDTRKLARRYFKFDSNRLDDLGQYLGVGRKEDVGGFRTWKGCMTGDRQAWRKMVKYNKQDVRLLEDVYYKLRPWAQTHPNVNVLDEKSGACPICGSTKVQKRGYSFTRTSKKQRYQCTGCGGWSTGKPERVKNVEIR